MLKGLVDAYRVFGQANYLELALRNARFLKEKLIRANHQLYHSYKNGRATIDAYLEDYAAVIEAYVALYQATFEVEWLNLAKELTDYAIRNFYDEQEGLFFFTDANAEKLIARKKEIFDNVIPASNSMMAKNLYWLHLYFEEAAYLVKARQMLGQLKKVVVENTASTANWATMYTYFAQPTAEVAIIGEQVQAFRQEIDHTYFPNKILVGTEVPQDTLPLLQNRGPINDATTLYVCYNKACQLPVNSVTEAWKQMKGE